MSFEEFMEEQKKKNLLRLTYWLLISFVLTFFSVGVLLYVFYSAINTITG